MRLREILLDKGGRVYSISPWRPLQEVADRLMEYGCGSLVVIDRQELVGIITERDILRTVARSPQGWEQLSVAEVMTRRLHTATPEDKVADVMGRMTEYRIRHLPVVDEGQLVGIVSIGDVVKAHHDALSMENYYLKNYIQG